jgi:hypothetical protein
MPESRRGKIIIVVLALLVLGVGVYAFVLYDQLVQLREDSSRTIAAHLETIALRNQQVEALDALANRVDEFNRQFGSKIGKINVENLEGTIDNLKQKGHLPDDAKRTLDQFEQSAAEIDAMTTKMKEFERYLGAPVTVKRGETHKQIAERYLTEEAKLGPKEAEEVVRKTALDWEVEPGNQIFNLYHDGLLLTTVTQGTAKRPPMLAQWAKRRATEAKTRELEDKIKELEDQLAAAPTSASASGDGGAAPSKVAPGTFVLQRTDPR